MLPYLLLWSTIVGFGNHCEIGGLAMGCYVSSPVAVTGFKRSFESNKCVYSRFIYSSSYSPKKWPGCWAILLLIVATLQLDAMLALPRTLFIQDASSFPSVLQLLQGFESAVQPLPSIGSPFSRFSSVFSTPASATSRQTQKLLKELFWEKRRKPRLGSLHPPDPEYLREMPLECPNHPAELGPWSNHTTSSLQVCPLCCYLLQ